MFLFKSLLGFLAIAFASAQGPLVGTTTGTVRGREALTIELGQTYYAFQGIPYAEAPIGNLRFAPPVAKTPWAGIYDAIADRDYCIQGGDIIEGAEDCLFISVYTPSLPTPGVDPLPVMVFIHGGGFEGGHAQYDLYGPDYLLEKGVVYVSINYRLGLLGFMATGDMVVPGNNGMKDQVLALTWIKNNIAQFGGDANHITIFGQSAGSASVSYHLQSPKSTGLFHQAIMQSGTSLCAWAFGRHLAEIAKTTATNLLLNTTTSESMVAALRSVDVLTLQTEAAKVANSVFMNYGATQGLPFGPVIEPDHPDAFFTEVSHERLGKGLVNRVPVIVGFNSLEGTFAFSAAFRLMLFGYDLNPGKMVPVSMNITSSLFLSAAGKNIKSHYFPTSTVALAADLEIMQWLSDDQFNRGIREFVRMYSNFAPVYYYRFNFEGNLWGITNRTVPGVGHSEELGYLFRSNYAATPEDILTRERMTTMWTNFAKYGSPTPAAVQSAALGGIDWASSDQHYTYIEIGPTMAVKQYPEAAHMPFWDNLYASYGVPPYDTY